MQNQEKQRNLLAELIYKNFVSSLKRKFIKIISDHSEQAIFDTVKKHDVGVHKGNIIKINQTYSLLSKDDKYVTFEKNKSIILLKAFSTIEYNSVKRKKEINFWISVAFNARQIYTFEALQVANMFKSNILTSLFD